jgi:A/G-specific adenine glycosylase
LILARRISEWFEMAHRDLPWRRGYGAYGVWVSEIMLQQTQVETVISYYQGFTRRFPSLRKLAAASEDSVLQVWAGLGYYSRARNLHRAAKAMMREHGGRVPTDPKVLVSLPGIGRYTAGAIASIAYERPAPIVDGNISRVLSRVFALDFDVTKGEGKKRLWLLAEALVQRASPRSLNQGLMELGALVCTPRSPGCGECPVRRSCTARKLGEPTAYPLPKARPQTQTRSEVFAVVCQKGRYLIAKRKGGLRYGGLWEFPRGESPKTERGCGDVPPSAKIAKAFREQHALRIRPAKILGEIEYGIMNFRVRARFIKSTLLGDLPEGETYEGFRWVARRSLGRFAMPAPVRRFVREIL